MQNTEGGLAEWFGDGQLVHLFIVALLEVHDLALTRAADKNHGEAVGRCIRKRCKAIEKARGRYCEADARLLSKKACDCRRIARILLMAEGNYPHSLGLGHAGEIGNGDSWETKNSVDVIELEGINDQMKTIGEFNTAGNIVHFRNVCHTVSQFSQSTGIHRNFGARGHV